MKAIIADCIKGAVTEDFGIDKWRAVAEKVGIPHDIVFSKADDIDDAVILKTVGAICEVLNVDVPAVAEVFGRHWIAYTKRLYAPLYAMHQSSREFLVAIDDIHQQATKFIPGAEPPKFVLDWKDDKTVLVTYKSKRNMIDFAICITKSLGEHYNETLTTEKVSDEQFTVTFP